MPNFQSGQIITAEQLNNETSAGTLLADLASSGASGAMTSIGTVVSLPGTEYMISNTDDVSHDYLVLASVRVVSTAAGLYRPLVTDATPAALGGGTEQIDSSIAGARATGGNTFHVVTLAAAGTQTVRAGGLRVAGGATTDTFDTGRLRVFDLGPA